MAVITYREALNQALREEMEWIERLRGGPAGHNIVGLLSIAEKTRGGHPSRGRSVGTG